MQAEEQKTFALEIVDAVLRSWWTIVVALCLGGATAIVALRYLPKTYEASTTILVTRPKISPQLVPTTVQDDMKLRMAALREAVLSRPYLERIYKEHYPPVAEGEELERKLVALRWNVDVNVRRGLFTISYRDSDPQRSADVVNTLAQLYIDENAAFRTSRAEDATTTLEELAAAALEELNSKERAILDFKAKHPFEIEGHRDSNIRMRELRQRDLETTQQSRKYEEERLEDLRSDLNRASSGVPGAMPTDESQIARLSVLEAELRDLLTHYFDNHPTVRAKRREIEELKRNGAVSPPTGDDGSSPAVSTAVLRLQEQIAKQERTVSQLRNEEVRIKKDIARLDGRIEATPLVQAELAELTKGYDALRERYEDYQSKVESAKGSQQLEAKRKGEQFEVIERAIASALPVRPRPIVVFGASLAFALVLFVGPVVLRRIVNPLVWSESGLNQLSEVPVLVSIPLLETNEVVRHNRRRRLAGLGVSALSAGILAAVIVFVYLGVSPVELLSK